MVVFHNSSSSYTEVKIEVSDECEERLKGLFDEALLVFLEEEDNNRPLPPILGDGVKVDLFKLFLLVRKRGGSASVSSKGLWESVAEQLGLDCSLSPSLRLVYSKYLERMDKWAMEKSRIVNWDDQESEKKGCLGGMLHELGDGFKRLLENGKCGKRNRACNPLQETGSSELQRSGKRFRDDDERVQVTSVHMSDASVGDEVEEGMEVSSEKKQDLPEMLEWLISVARRPHDHSIGVLPHWSRWNQYPRNECWIQVIRAKQALMIKRGDIRSRFQNLSLLGQQSMHPSMYENDRKSTERLRCRVRRPNSSKPSSSNPPGRGKTAERRERRAGTSGVQSNATRKTNKPEHPRRYVAVGRQYQALVEDWTGPNTDSDPKWLGTRVWPLKNEDSLEQTVGNDMVGKGRADSCSCETFLPGSVECIRFHIAEKRMELKRELGDVFFHWRFNEMGEEVSLRWTEREEKKFKSMYISDPKDFWDNAVKTFRGKKRNQLVSYYFNVLLINRRRYQNRVTPRDIDSDDDAPFGAVGNRFGSDAVTPSASDIMICSQNNQCMDFD